MTYNEICESMDNQVPANYTMHDISHEQWRDYEHGGMIYRVVNPVALIIRKGGTTHRVVDVNNIVHCHPIPGDGCAVRWFNGEKAKPVNF